MNRNSPTEEIFLDGGKYFSALISDITNATKSIDLETYIFSFDKLGKKFVIALKQAAQKQVRIRILVDGAGSPSWGGSLTRQLEKAGIETRVFHPFPWRFWQWSRSVIKLPWILKVIYLGLKINSRNHRKVCIIDNNIVYVGSENITQCHLPTEQGGQAWRDTGVKLTNTNLSSLKAAFIAAWNHTPIQERIQKFFKEVNTNPVFRINNSRHRRRILHKNLLRKIDHCKHRIWITNAYFVPDNFLLKRLKDAAQRNIDVRVLLPQKSDVFMMPWASETFYSSLLKSGVRIFEYLPSMLHAKTLIIDDWMSVGSSNLNHRSLLHDLEVDVHIRQPESKQLLVDQFAKDLTASKEAQLDNPRKRSWYQRAIGRLALYMKYWI